MNPGFGIGNPSLNLMRTCTPGAYRANLASVPAVTASLQRRLLIDHPPRRVFCCQNHPPTSLPTLRAAPLLSPRQPESVASTLAYLAL